MANYYEKILNPDYTVKEQVIKLLPLYLIDYGEENLKTIIRRINDAVFFFEATPDITHKFIVDHKSDIDRKEVIQREKEYLDYEYIRKNLLKEAEAKFCNFLGDYMYPGSKPKLDTLLNLDFDSYNIDSFLALKKGDTEISDRINKRRKEYAVKCMELGISKITDPLDIEDIILYRKKLIDDFHRDLIAKTKWGKRIKEDLLTKYNFSVGDKELADAIYDRELTAFTGIVKDTNGNDRVVMYIPFTERYNEELFPRIILHELRHVVESDKEVCGLASYTDAKYDMINEVRTEKNAIRDEFLLGDKCLFKRGDKHSVSLYELMFNEAGSFFECEKDTIDRFAIKGDIEGFENEYGKENLQCMNLYFKLSVSDEYDLPKKLIK